METITNEQKKAYMQVIDLVKLKSEGDHFSPGGSGWMASPFSWGEKTCATNGWSLVITPKIGEFEDMSKKLSGILPFDSNMNKIIKVSELKESMKKAPIVDCFDDVVTTCEACDGSKVVDYIFEFGDGEYVEEFTCPVCDGTGKIESVSTVPNGKKELDYEYSAVIESAHFNLHRIDELLKIAEILEAEEIILLNQKSEVHPCYLKILDVILLLMPTSPTEKIAFSIHP